MAVDLGFAVDEGCVAEHFVVAEAQGAVAGFVLREEEGVFVFVGHFFQLGGESAGVVGQVAAEQVDLLHDGGLGSGQGLGGRVGQFAADDEQAGTDVAGDVGVDFGEEVGFLHQTAVETRGMAVAEKVGEHVVGMEEGAEAVAHVPGKVEGVVGDVAAEVFGAGLGLRRFGGVDPLGHFGMRGGIGGTQGAEKLLYECQRGAGVDIACNGEDGIVGAVEAVVELADVVEGGFLHMADVGSDGAPAIGMALVAEGSQVHPDVAVGLVDVALVVFFSDDFALHIKHFPVVAVGVPVASHAVGFEREGLGQMLGGDGEVVIGVVVVGEGVGLAPQGIDGTVEIGYLAGAAEHEVLEKVGKACAVGFFVARPYAIE